MISTTSTQFIHNLARIRQEISDLAQRAGRAHHEIKLIAVSKQQPLSTIEMAVSAGQAIFGENTVQDALTKIPHLTHANLEWHFIGHIQSNKAKFVPSNFSWIHSLDNLLLATKLSRLAQQQGIQLQSLIEVNISADPRKHGVPPSQLWQLLDSLMAANLPGISLRGLMMIAPQSVSEIALRRCFAQLRQLRDNCQQHFALPQFTELSMGMSSDFAAAIAEGATFVRLGTALFGDRNKK